jgi:hypothetical protein
LRLVIGPEGADAWPAGWVVTYPDLPIESEDLDRMARERCPLIHLFPDRSRLERWRRDLPPARRDRMQILTVSTAFAVARQRVAGWPEE